MTANTTRRFARDFALPVVSAGILAGALGFAGAASAGTYSQPDPAIVAGPSVKAHPAPSALPGTHHHDRIAHVMHLEPSYHP